MNEPLTNKKRFFTGEEPHLLILDEKGTMLRTKDVLSAVEGLNEEFEEFTEVSEVLKSSPKKKKKIDVRKLNKSLLNL